MVCSSFDSSGRMEQLEYAIQAANRGNGILAVKTSEGVVVMTTPSKEAKYKSTISGSKLRRILNGPHIITAGLTPDARYIEEEAFEFCANYLQTYGAYPPIARLASHIASIAHERTLSPSMRPLGASCCLIGRGNGKSLDLIEVDPVGQCYDCAISSIGDRAQRILKRWPHDRVPSELSLAEAVECIRDLFAKENDDELAGHDEGSDGIVSLEPEIHVLKFEEQ